MGEIKVPIEKMVAEPSGEVFYLITEKHSIADIARWCVEERYDDELLYLLNHKETL